MWGHPTASGRLRARICRLPLVSSHSAVLCARRHIRQVPHQWNKSRDTSSPGNKISVGRYTRPREVWPTPPRIWVVPHALRTTTPFFLPHTQAKKLPTQRKPLSRLTTTRECTHKRRLRPFPPRNSLSTDEFPQHGERNKQQDRPEHLLSTAFSSSTEPQVSRPSAQQIVTFRVSTNPNPIHDTTSCAHKVLSATLVAKDATW